MGNFYAHFAAAAERFADRPAIDWIGAAGPETSTYDALLDESARVAEWLSGPAGLTAGDRITILAANDTRWVAGYLGALRQGVVVVPLDTAYTPTQVAAVTTDSGARVLLTSARYLDTAREAAALGGPQRLRIALLSGDADGVDGPRDLTATRATSPPVDVAPDHPAVVLYTSGTTADPKGVVLTHANLDAERAAVLAVIRANESDVVLGVLPLFHALAEMANLWLPLTIGARLVFLESVSSTTLIDALQTRGVTILACVPQFYYLIHQRVLGEIGRRGLVARGLFRTILRVNVVFRDRLGWNPGHWIFRRVHRTLGPRMRLFITGGSRFDPAIALDLYGLGLNLINGYGLTETSGAAAIMRPGDRFSTSVGPPLPGVEVRIAPADAIAGSPPAAGVVPAASGRDGEILVRGPIVMREYWRRPEATAAILQDGWLHTGDLGLVDGEGRLHITGRQKEVIVLSSGKNVYPEEVEAHYQQSLFIKELCVLGLSRPDAPSTERLHAVIVPDDAVMRERGIVNLKELIRFECEGLSVQLPAHKRILSYDISRDPLARTTTGKLRRNEIERLARKRAEAPVRDGPATPAETAWLAHADHATAVAAIAAHLRHAHVRPEANLELDLGLDSMERVELLTLMEQRRGARVAPEARAMIFTVRELIDAVDAAAPVGPAGDSASGPTALPWDAILAQPADPALVRDLTRPKIVRKVCFFVALRIAAVGARILLGLRTAGRSHLPGAAPFIVCPNHQTFLDGFLVAAALPFGAFRQIFFVGATEYFDTPFMAWGARAINIVPVDPDANLVDAMQAATTGLRLGKVLMIFPEGERTIDGSLKTFRKGSAILAAHLDLPLVPVTIDGLFPIWSRGRSLDWTAVLARSVRASLTFGSPIRVAPGDYVEGTKRLRRAVAEAMTPPPAG